MDELTVAAAQIECVPGDLDANIARHLAALKAARADIVVFPEASLADYVSVPDLPRVGMARDDPRLLELARAAHASVCVGFVERAGAEHFIATATLVGGTVVHVHRKLNLATYGSLVEGHHYAKGRTLDLCEASGWRAATLICADAWNPALPWIAALKGAEIAIVPIASALGAVDGEFDNPSGWDWTLRQIAMTYGMPIIMANHCGRPGNLDFWGGSRIVDPFGRVLAELGEEPGLALATLRRSDMDRARSALPTVRDADPALVARLIGEIACH